MPKILHGSKAGYDLLVTVVVILLRDLVLYPVTVDGHLVEDAVIIATVVAVT